MVESFLKYLRYEKRLSHHTLLAYEHDLNQFGEFLQMSFEIATEHATYPMIRSWIAQLAEAKLEPRSINRKIATLRSFFKYLLIQEAVASNPMQKIRVLKTDKPLPAFVRENDIVSVFEKPFENTFTGWRDRLVLELFYATGIRLSELLTLSEKNIDLKQQTIKVLGKRNKERVIPFTQNLVSIIKSYTEIRNRDVSNQNHGLLLVTETGSACYPMLIYRIVKEHLQATTAERKSPHILRHTYATHLLDKGAEINAVKDLLGHSSLAATQVYTHNSMEKLKKVFDQAHPKA